MALKYNSCFYLFFFLIIIYSSIIAIQQPLPAYMRSGDGCMPFVREVILMMTTMENACIWCIEMATCILHPGPQVVILYQKGA